jgi:hypothetical protein
VTPQEQAEFLKALTRRMRDYGRPSLGMEKGVREQFERDFPAAFTAARVESERLPEINMSLDEWRARDSVGPRPGLEFRGRAYEEGVELGSRAAGISLRYYHPSATPGRLKSWPVPEPMTYALDDGAIGSLKADALKGRFVRLQLEDGREVSGIVGPHDRSPGHLFVTKEDGMAALVSFDRDATWTLFVEGGRPIRTDQGDITPTAPKREALPKELEGHLAAMRTDVRARDELVLAILDKPRLARSLSDDDARFVIPHVAVAELSSARLDWRRAFWDRDAHVVRDFSVLGQLTDQSARAWAQSTAAERPILGTTQSAIRARFEAIARRLDFGAPPEQIAEQLKGLPLEGLAPAYRKFLEREWSQQEPENIPDQMTRFEAAVALAKKAS